MIKKIIFSSTVLVFLTLSLQVEVTFGQETDFLAFPERVADYEHLELNLEITEDLDIRGDALYTFNLLRVDSDSIRLNAVRISMETIELNGEEADFRIDDDQIIIKIPEELSVEESHQLRIQYRANPVFGVFKNRNGTIWSSGMPASVRHWLPVKDHPRNSFTTDINLIFPTGNEAVFAGERGNTEVESVDLQRVRFQSDERIPVSSLRFAIGDFVRTQSTVGDHQITLYSERDLLGDDELGELLNDARDTFQFTLETLGSEYFSRVLNLIVLDDHHWETRPYGAGTVFAYTSLGFLSEQIASGVIGQWLGVQLREEQWSDPDAILLLQAWLLEQSGLNIELPSESPDMFVESIYNHFGMDSRAAWRSFFRSDDSERYKAALNNFDFSGLKEQSEVVNWYDFTTFLYNRTGRNLMEKPSPETPEMDDEDEQIPVYRVVYHHNEEEERLRLEFIGEDATIDELVSLRVREVTFNDEREREITFTGTRDEVHLNVNRGIENLTLYAEDDQQVKLKPEKPFRFWIYQLQHDEDAEKRREAAVGLRNFTENPDLQLALLDIIDSEENEEVFAEALKTLSYVTNGASGTDQLFTQRYSGNAGRAVQLAIVEAYSDYNGNERVISQLQSILQNTAYTDVQRQAVRSLSAIADDSRFQSISESALTNEAIEPIAPFILRELARANDADTAVSIASSFLDDRFPYRNRVEVLDLLLDYDRSSDRWVRRINHLLEDNDPRIRMRALDGLQFLDSSERNAIIDERLYEEYDDRVISRLKMLQG